MIDVQSKIDTRKIPINKVGIKNIKYPICILKKNKDFESTVANINMYVSLSENNRGTHMSRFIEILNKYQNKINIQKIDQILCEIKNKLSATEAYFEMNFPFFIKKKAPISISNGFMNYDCYIKSSINKNNKIKLIIGVIVPVTTLCPCSKAISINGAHNQRSHVTLFVQSEENIFIEDLIEVIEQSSSCEIYSLLKRQDEKYVTEKAFNNPYFVEDVVREISLKMEANPNITWFTVESENFESIHNHNAYAFIEKNKKH